MSEEARQPIPSRHIRARRALRIFAVVAAVIACFSCGAIAFVGYLLASCGDTCTSNERARSWLVAVLIGVVFVALAGLAAYAGRRGLRAIGMWWLGFVVALFVLNAIVNS